VGEYTTQIKAVETNQHVLNHVLFWADVLSRANPKSTDRGKIIIQLDSKPVMVIDKLPVSGLAKFAILYDPATFDEPTPSAQLSFLNWFEQPEADSDDQD
jgi:hypothetical protein